MLGLHDFGLISLFSRGNLATFRPKFKKELGQFYFYTHPLAGKTKKYSKLVSKKLGSTCPFLPWVNYVRGDLCLLLESTTFLKMALKS